MGLIHKEEKHEVKHTSFLSLLGTVFNNISHYFSTAPAKPTVKTLLDPKRAQNLGACATSTNCLSSEQFSFQLSIESYLGLPRFCFNSLCGWSSIVTPPSQPIKSRTKINSNLVSRVFPRFKQVASFYFEFSLVNDDVLIGSCDNFGFSTLN